MVPVVSPSAGGADFRLMLANVLTSNPEHQAIIDCGLANIAEVIVILELSSELAQKLEKEWAVSHPYQKTLPQGWANFGIGAYSKWPFEKAEGFETTESVPSGAITFDP